MLSPATRADPTLLTVLYDGACPLCRREIALYRGLSSKESVCYVDVNATNFPLPVSVSRSELLARFHVQDENGNLHSGARAFLRLWSALPGWRWLARLGGIPGAVGCLEGAYLLFLRVRPLMQRIAQRWDRGSSNR